MCLCKLAIFFLRATCTPLIIALTTFALAFERSRPNKELVRYQLIVDNVQSYRSMKKPSGLNTMSTFQVKWS